MKHSDRDPDVQKFNGILKKENAELKEDLGSLKELLKLQKTLTHGSMFTQSSVQLVARSWTSSWKQERE